MATRPYEGEPAPAFSLQGKNGDTVSLSDYSGKIVVLYFYPADDTPGCTKQGCSFRDLSAEFAAANAVVLGVSPDDAASHEAFAAKYALTFPLLSDTDHAVAELYGAWKEKNNYGRKYMGIERTTFVIGKDGNIAKVFGRVRVDGHGDAVLNFVKGLI
ncbi:MAG: thioredoxin-dependent thiol peroxidase [Armatimonadetes bacterium]|nr:thioredoxin-dependent thiol peroxidase [Armatimonadota bacterium]